jgi:NAD-dependent dihydropyrimidine dehydrogenase PreA subunit
MAQGQYAGVPREKIDWFPTINPDLCKPDACQKQCVRACPRNIYERTEQGAVVVARPYECTVGDISCSFACPFEAISFPSRQALKKMLEDARKNLDKGSGI